MASGKRSGEGGLGIVLRLVQAAVRWRRSVRGPLRPSWDVAFETWATFLRAYALRSIRLPLAVQRLMASGIIRPARPRGMRYEIVSAGGVPAEWFRPAGCDESRVVLYLHGGGYSIGSIDTHRGAVSRICRAAGARGLVIDYRLAPEHPFPAQLDDALAAYRWLLESGVHPGRIVVAGESAGGGLTLSLLLSLREQRIPLPAAAVCASPWIDLEMRGESMRTNARYDYVSRKILAVYASRFVGPGDLRNPLANALHAELRGLPPLLVLAGGAEVLLDDARALAARAREAGVDVTLEVEPDMVHAWILFAKAFERSRATLDRIARFVVQQQGPGAVSALRAS
jgi:phosphinothricin tripeptide acetyl hydrolase